MVKGRNLQGRLGQVRGPFEAGVDLLSKEGAISVFTPESTPPVLVKLGIQTTEGAIVQINKIEIKIGRTGMYELDETVPVKSLIFPDGADEDTIVDFVY